ncbi:MAG: flavin reductase [Alphaproteobacteria bacterium]|nr:flavin reductase [Alphaproteobacteria bacterium]
MVHFDPNEVGMKPPPLKHTVYNALVVPRPIGWISTMSPEGDLNLAPYSFFNSVSGSPPCVVYCPNYFKPGTREVKDSLTNVEETGEFVYNMCTAELLDQMVVTSKHSPRNYDEMAEARLEAVPCVKVKPPRIKASPISVECKYLQTVNLPTPPDGSRAAMVIGHIVQIHIADEVITDEGLIDMKKLRPVGRLGYYDYTIIEPENIFQVKTPDDDRFSGDNSKGWHETSAPAEFVQE